MDISSINEAFGAAFSFSLKGKARGTQAKIAEEAGVDPANVSAMKRYGKGSSEEVRRIVFLKLLELCPDIPTKTYEDFLSLGRWILDKNDPDKWKASLRGHIAKPIEFIVPQDLSKSITRERPLSEILLSLPASQKYQEAKGVLVAGIGISELEADKLLMKHMGLPPDLAGSLPEEKQERFAHIWEYACVKNQGLKKTAYPADKESLLEQYLKGEIDDVTLYLKAIDWLDELFGDGGEPK